MKSGLDAWLPTPYEGTEEYKALSELEKLCYEPDNFWSVDRSAYAYSVMVGIDAAYKAMAAELAKDLSLNNED